MRDGKAIPIWFTDEDRNKLEEAAALAGYKHLSKYIRDKALGRGAGVENRGSVGAWAEAQELNGRIAEVGQRQRRTEALLAFLVFLARKKATAGEVGELVATYKRESSAGVLDAALPELAALKDLFTEDF